MSGYKRTLCYQSSRFSKESFREQYHFLGGFVRCSTVMSGRALCNADGKGMAAFLTKLVPAEVSACRETGKYFIPQAATQD
jgi:hypothetical protein